MWRSGQNVLMWECSPPFWQYHNTLLLRYLSSPYRLNPLMWVSMCWSLAHEGDGFIGFEKTQAVIMYGTKRPESLLKQSVEHVIQMVFFIVVHRLKKRFNGDSERCAGVRGSQTNEEKKVLCPVDLCTSAFVRDGRHNVEKSSTDVLYLTKVESSHRLWKGSLDRKGEEGAGSVSSRLGLPLCAVILWEPESWRLD